MTRLTTLCGCAVLGFILASTPIRAQAAGSASALDALLSAIVIVNGDEVAREWTMALEERSPTFRDMLRVLHRATHLHVTLVSRMALRRSSGLPARGTFAARGDGRVDALLEFDRSSMDPLRELRAIAHEIAHAVEVACLPAAASSDALRAQLQSRKGRRVVSREFGERIETPFPIIVTSIIMTEHDRDAPEGRLRAIAAMFDLTLPRPGDVVADTTK